jgi:hypothetical protein
MAREIDTYILRIRTQNSMNFRSNNRDCSKPQFKIQLVQINSIKLQNKSTRKNDDYFTNQKIKNPKTIQRINVEWKGRI